MPKPTEMTSCFYAKPTEMTSCFYAKTYGNDKLFLCQNLRK